VGGVHMTFLVMRLVRFGQMGAGNGCDEHTRAFATRRKRRVTVRGAMPTPYCVGMGISSVRSCSSISATLKCG
jgi:hypothetical protein